MSPAKRLYVRGILTGRMELYQHILPGAQVDLELARLVQRRVEQRHQFLMGDVRPAFLRVRPCFDRMERVVVAVQQLELALASLDYF